MCIKNVIIGDLSMQKKYIILFLSLTFILVIIGVIFLTCKNKKEVAQVNKIVQTEKVIQDDKNTLHGSVKIIDDFYSPELNNKKTLRIYLPYGYENSDKKYPVIYMQDGQCLFDAKTSTLNMEWGIDETLDALYTDGKTDGAIVVGVDSIAETRTDEYNPFFSMENKTRTAAIGGKGNKYAEFIVNTLKPYIDKNYKTLSDKANTAIVGSSYGAVISLYTAIEFNDKFGMVGALSFYGELNATDMNNYLTNNLSAEKLQNTKIYFYVGTQDFAYNSTNNAYNTAKKNNLTNLLYEEDNGTHNENSWRPRFKNCVQFFGL